jgi:hypothetical protein
MLRFGTKNRRSVRNFSSRREQLRLLALFVPLALVILFMARLRDPKTAAAINTFFAGAEPQQHIKPRPLVAGSAPPRSPTPIPGIRDDVLKTVEDNTYFRTAEKDAWFHFFELVQKEEIGPAQGVPVEYAQLVDQPNVYRGKLVTVRGTARQITQEKPADNDLGIASYYQVVIQPADGANWPIVVYCLELPKGTAVGDRVSLDVSVTGLFFKKLSYTWRDGLGIAPVIVARTLTTGPASGTTAPEALAENVQQAPADNIVESTNKLDDSGNEQNAFQQIMTLAGWDATQLAQFDDGKPLSDAQRVEAIELLRRLRSINSADLAAWSSSDPIPKELEDTDVIRGRLSRLNGIVTKVTKLEPSPEDAARLEMPAYFDCEFETDEFDGPITILTARVPNDWPRDEAIDEVASTNVLFVKRLTDENPPRTLWLAKEIAWHPRFKGQASGMSINELPRDTSDPLLGKSLLGTLNVDVGKFDLVESRGRIRAQERDLFYETMNAAGRVKPSTFVHIAIDDLPIVLNEWQQRVRDGKSGKTNALAREVVRRADNGQYSVALLFNDPQPQIGRLFVFDGVARRAVRVEVGEVADGDGASDVAKRYAIDHYYELEVFTNDSQNYPLIFCVRELPKEFPIGGSIDVPVRIAGFFFKNWLYSTRGRGHSEEPEDAKSTGPQAQFAPLLIGRAPIVLETPTANGRAGQYVLGGLFVLGLAGICAAAAWFARDDRRFRERTAAANYELPAGQSLNDLNLPTADVPMIDLGVQPPARDSSD